MIKAQEKSAGLKRNEILKSRTEILSLFQNGKRFKAFPLHMVCHIINADSEITPLQILFSVSKRKIRKAVGRNRIKRLLRQAYRLNKSLMDDPKNKLKPGQKLVVAFIYVDNHMPDYKRVENSMLKLMLRMHTVAQEHNKG